MHHLPKLRMCQLGEFAVLVTGFESIGPLVVAITVAIVVAHCFGADILANLLHFDVLIIVVGRRFQRLRPNRLPFAVRFTASRRIFRTEFGWITARCGRLVVGGVMNGGGNPPVLVVDEVIVQFGAEEELFHALTAVVRAIV